MILSRDSLLAFLDNNRYLGDSSGDQKALVILPDNITIKNLSRALAARDFSLRNLTLATFDVLSERIIDPEKKGKTRIIDKNLVTQLIVQSISESSTPPLSELKSIPIDEISAQEALFDEFNEFLKATDTGTLTPQLSELANNLKDPFARRTSLRFIESFNLLRESVTKKTELLGENIFFSRTHMDKKAREVLDSSWPSILEVNEVLISNISVFNASILKLITKIDDLGKKTGSSFKVRVFLGVGTYNLFKDRLIAAKIPFEESDSYSTSEAQLLDSYNNDSLTFMAAPERRREVDFIANQIHDLLVKGTHPSEILLVARDSSLYLDLVTEIFTAYGIANHVQTRRPFAHLSPYRFLKATTELLVAAETNEINWDQITDPLRLGLCLPSGYGKFPVQARDFICLEEALSRIQRKNKGLPISLSDWREKINSEVRLPSARNIALELLQWISQQLANPPKDPRESRYLLSTLLDQFMLQASVWVRKSSSNKVMDPGRFAINELHPTHFAARIKSQLFSFEAYLNDCHYLLYQSQSWKLIDKGLGLVLGKGTYGLPRQDISSIPMVNAANTSFLKAKHLFMLGLRSEEFPRRCPKGVFLPEELRDALSTPQEGESAYLYLRNSSNDYANECDDFEKTLRTSPTKITFLMPYHDERNHVLAWSPFVEKQRPDKKPNARMAPNDWLPSSTTNTWLEIAKKYPPWIRHRLYCFNSYRAFPNLTPSIDNSGLEEIAETIDPSFFLTHLKDRIDRYIEPPQEIEVQTNEAWFNEYSLENIIGPPFRIHEMNLHGSCPFQLYFYQFLYLWDGNAIDRDTIPTYYKSGHWRLGRIPKTLSHLCTSSQTNESIEKIIQAFSDRQKDLQAYHSEIDLENKLTTLLSNYAMTQLRQTILDERALVLQELRDNIKTRQWRWQNDKTPVNIPGITASLILPPHRIDTLQFNKQFIASYVPFSGQLNGSHSRIMYLREKADIENASDPLRDYQIPVLLTYYLSKSNVAAAIYIELFGGKRMGYYNDGDLPKHKGRSGYKQELEMPPLTNELKGQVLKPLEWNKRVTQFKKAIEERISKMSIKNDSISFKAQPTPEVCAACVYSNLCQIQRLETM